MKKSETQSVANPSRRKFVVSSAAAGGGLAIGMQLPLGSALAATAQAAAPIEVNAWVLVKPDDTLSLIHI